ncbi:MAG: hydrogenase iron-sulfur subunit [Proteobacteria bacterium]|nr:hydrogenase iron-sulfur subunit [Pseudomonadota bacterium]MBU1739974.1 hydrogenase iron-sulfur subunit [Pseudomonadota bacterium]
MRSPTKRKPVSDEALRLVVFVCANSGLADKLSEPRPEVAIRPVELPCSSKTESHVLLRAFQNGAAGVVLAACPKGQCRFIEGNLRAEKRIGRLRRIMDEIGLDPERIEIIFADAPDPADAFSDFVSRIVDLGPTGVRP